MTHRNFFWLLISTVISSTFFNSASAQSDKKYPSLLWEISGNGLEKPSYLFGTMHVSSKIAFHLGTPLFDALESVDRVALELEPEFWFDEILGGDLMGSVLGRNNIGNGGGYNNSWNEYRGRFKINQNIQNRVQGVYKESMGSMNQLLFRFSDLSGNFEENTWLDMYIYQSAKKLKKETLGLETFQESMAMQVKSAEAAQTETELPSAKLTYEERTEIGGKIETSYRNGDLDMLDSLNKLVAAPSFLKYILIERNKNFIAGLDTLLKQKPIFAAMGAAHLPGEEGCIEMLRELGYTVKPISMGKRDGKQKKKLEEMVVKRELRPFTSSDGNISFQSPFHTYSFAFEKNSARYISMDIANGLTFMLTRLQSYNAMAGKSSDQLMKEIDNVLYETIPGEIISKKKITTNGIAGFDILNKTRRGDYNRSQIYFLKNEIIIARLGGSGEKVKNGAGEEYFTTLSIKETYLKEWTPTTVTDGSFTFLNIGNSTCYSYDSKNLNTSNYFVTSTDNDGVTFLTFRTKLGDQKFLEEDKYMLDKVENAFRNDYKLDLIDNSIKYSADKRELLAIYKDKNDKQSAIKIVMNDLGFYILYAITADLQKIEKYFNGVSLKNSTNINLHKHTDSTLFFSSQVPWKIEENGLGNMMKFYSSYGRKDDYQNLNNTFNKTEIITNPNSTEWLSVEYRRKGLYDYTDDKVGYEEDVDNEMTLGKDLKIDEKEFIWDKNNYTANYILSDTLSSRKYEVKILFKNRAVHVIRTSYDENNGTGDFYKSFVDNFSTIDDTLNIGSYFESSQELFMTHLMGSDSTYFQSAHKNLRDMYYLYGKEVTFDTYKLLQDSIPPLAEEEHKKKYTENLRYYLYLDKSQENINDLKKKFYESSDSAYYQQQIIENLINMETKDGILAAKELLLKEAPLGNSVYPFDFIYQLSDSLELAALLYPEILDLTNYEEYKYCWTNLLATMIDSNIVKKDIYKSYVPYFTREAKAEFRRLTSSKEPNLNDYDYDYDYSDNFMADYWTLLYPYKSDAQVAEIFNNSEASTKRLAIEEYATFLHKKGQKVSDELCLKMLHPKEQLTNYYLLDNIDRLDLFPDTINIVELFMETSINENWDDKGYTDVKIDSLIKLDQHADSIRARKYTTYYYQYQKTEYDKVKTFYAVFMIQPTEDNGFFKHISKQEMVNQTMEKEEQLLEMRMKLIDNNRDNDYLGRNSYKYDYSYDYNNYYDYE